MSGSHFSTKSFMKLTGDEDLSSEMSVSTKKTIYSDSITHKNQPHPKTTSVQTNTVSRVRTGKFNTQSAFDRHKQLVNNYLMYYGKGKGKSIFQPDKSKYKRDIDVVRENHRFLWEDDEGEEISEKDLKWEQRVAKKYWDKLFTEYAICDLTYFKKNRIAFRWRIEKEVVSGKGQFICAQKKVCDEKEGLRTWEVNFGYVEDDKPKYALVKVRLCATCSAKLNSNKKYREVRRERNRLALLKEEEGAIDSEREKLRRQKRKAELEEKASSSTESKRRLTDKEQKEKMKLDEDALGEEKDKDDIWHQPATIDEEKTKEQEMDDYFEDLFM